MWREKGNRERGERYEEGSIEALSLSSYVPFPPVPLSSSDVRLLTSSLLLLAFGSRNGVKWDEIRRG